MSDSDRELLELAAKACGFDTSHKWNAQRMEMTTVVVSLVAYQDGRLVSTAWNPIRNDGDALRMAVLLSLRVEPYTGVKIHDAYPVANVTDVYSLHYPEVKLSELHDLDPAAATRRAIVRAAAEIGKSLK